MLLLRKRGRAQAHAMTKAVPSSGLGIPDALINVSSPVVDSLKPALPTHTNIQGKDWVAFKELELSYHNGRHGN